MNWDQIQGKWQEYKGKVKQRWGKLTDNDLTVINGKRDLLAGKIRERFGATKEQAEKELAEFEAGCCTTDSKPASPMASSTGCCTTDTDKVTAPMAANKPAKSATGNA